jgi:hypothetical protein
MTLQRSFTHFKDGPLAAACLGYAIWVFEGICGGIHDSVEATLCPQNTNVVAASR